MKETAPQGAVPSLKRSSNLCGSNGEVKAFLCFFQHDGILSDSTLSLPKLSDGIYTVSYRVTSIDGHQVTGSYWFAVGKVEQSRACTDILAKNGK
ncbi:copper resistance protein CopC [Ferviditalea candida]|uniref:Copper resistance protein CopC n=1 Tax=Ferviditalea candida TaxID=3108399 RepID=A0ABU5ZNB4_9BACL|nr:copper resistance protein CopC [Paenibacillaceae bacterium T2]